MKFGILRPLEVTGEGGPVALEGIKPRAVLAMLLLHANEPVSAERLAVALWGEAAPRSTTRAVQVYVSRWLKALGDPDLVATTPAGCRGVALGLLHPQSSTGARNRSPHDLLTCQPAHAGA